MPLWARWVLLAAVVLVAVTLGQRLTRPVVRRIAGLARGSRLRAVGLTLGYQLALGAGSAGCAWASRTADVRYGDVTVAVLLGGLGTAVVGPLAWGLLIYGGSGPGAVAWVVDEVRDAGVPAPTARAVGRTGAWTSLVTTLPGLGMCGAFMFVAGG